MKINIGITHYIGVFCIFLLTCLFCNWPDFHPERHIGMEYHWALDICFHGSYFFFATIVLLWLLSPYLRSYWVFIPLWLLSFFLEIIQLWVPGRTFTLLDIFSNTLGISMGTIIFWYTKRTLASK